MAVKRAFRGVVTNLAVLAGYVPTDKTWVDRLLAVRGEFRRSTMESTFILSMAVMAGGAAAFLLAFAFRLYRQDASSHGSLFFLGASLVLAAGTAYLFHRSRVRYVFEHGHVSSLTASGRVMWREDLAGLSDIQGTQVRGVWWLTLRWPDRQRKLELYDSLRAALMQHPASPDQALERPPEG